MIGILQQEFPEGADELQAYGLVRPGHRENEVYVRVDEFPHTRIAGVKLFQEVDGNWECAGAVILMKEDGVGNVAALHHAVKDLRYACISVNRHHQFSLAPTNCASFARYNFSGVSASVSS